MASERQNMSEEERSIQAREHELYVKPLPEEFVKPVKPFPVYLRETPAEPLSPTTKAILWMTGIVVAMLFFASLWKLARPRSGKAQAEIGNPVATTAMLLGPTSPRVDSRRSC
jgi:hypothetical protein